MRLVQIANGKIVNASIAAPGQAIPDGWIASTTAQIGWDVVDGEPVAPPPRSPEPQAIPNISFSQLLIGLVSEGWITEAEGDAWANSTLPAAVADLINALPPQSRFAARSRAKRPSEVVRTDLLVNSLGAAQGKTAAELDAFFIKYARV